MITVLIIWLVLLTVAWVFMAGAYRQEHRLRRDVERREEIRRRIA